MTNLNSSHEWYTVNLAIGHGGNDPLTDSVPWFSMKYRNEVTSDIQRRAGLCGAATRPPNYVPSRPCELLGKEGAQYQKYGMDTRLFHTTDEMSTDATEMDIELHVVWPVGASSVPVLVDNLRVWEIEWGVISH